MTDRELLELAAKAYLPEELRSDEGYMRGFLGRWNPLANQNAAFDLIVWFKMSVYMNESTEPDTVKVSAVRDDTGDVVSAEEWLFRDNDPYAATRRAIVRAAAQLA